MNLDKILCFARTRKNYEFLQVYVVFAYWVNKEYNKNKADLKLI